MRAAELDCVLEPADVSTAVIGYYLDGLPAASTRVARKAINLLKLEVINGNLSPSNFSEYAEEAVETSVYRLKLVPEDKVVDDELFQEALTQVLASVSWP